jgi:transaldolase
VSKDLDRVASVASFFVSRIDVAVDKLIDERLAQGGVADQRDALAEIQGKVAIANAKLAYQRYKRLFAGARWEKLRAKLAMPNFASQEIAPEKREQPRSAFLKFESYQAALSSL